MIPIQTIGEFHPMDADGFLCNDAAASRIGFPWSHAVEAIRDELIALEGANLVAVYIRGSVGQGTARFGVSDIDAVGITAGPPAPIDVGPREDALHRRFPFCTGVELVRVQRAALVDGDATRGVRFAIAVAGAHVHGEDLRPLLPRYRPDRTIAFHAPTIRTRLRHFQDNVDRDPLGLSRWLAKATVRAGFDLVIEDERRWTPHVERCWERFAARYPAWSEPMRILVDATVNPDRARVSAHAERLCTFIEAEWSQLRAGGN